MAPKKKGVGKKEKKDGVPTGEIEGASLEELNQKISTLEKEKNKEEEYRNYMQLERDKINAFWEILKRDLDDRKAELRNKDREMEEMEERHQVEIKVYKQKVKHLLYEHQNNITTLKADGELAIKLQQDEFRRHEGDLGKDKRNLRLELKEQEIHEIEERKNTHINELMKKHERAFAEIKNYYNDITHNNLDLIKTLKEDVAEMKKREAQNEKLMYEIAQENKRLSEPLTRALKEVEALRAQLASYEKDKLSLAQTKARLLNSEKQIRNLEWENEVLQQRFSKVQSERDELYDKFEASIYDVQQKTGLKSLLLEKRLEAVAEALEMKEAQLAEVLTAANLDPSTLSVINSRLEEVLDNKNQVIKALQYDVAKVSKAHNDLIRVYEAKLSEFGIPVEELGFRPLVTNTSTGPAGLVVGA
ncbi:MAG: hypothetical protein WDW38_008060 [Sanguina aurantia]